MSTGNNYGNKSLIQKKLLINILILVILQSLKQKK